MIQRCPECGAWCEASEDSLVDGFMRGASDTQEFGGDILGTFGGIFGKSGEKIGRTIVGSAFNGGLQALYGDSYHFVCSCGNEWSCNDESEDQTEEYNHIQEIIELKDRLYENDPSDISIIRSYVSEISEMIPDETKPELLSILYDIRSVAYWQLDELSNAYSDITQSLNLIDDAHCRALRGLYLLEEGHSDPESVIEVISDLTSIFEEGHEYKYVTEEYLNKALETVIDEYVKVFADLPPARRRFICFTDKVQAMGNNILVLPLGRLPERIYFPDGMPRKNVIYEVHPFKANHYLSIDNFEFDLFNDKISEFKWIMENLGAKKINVIIESDKSQDISQNARREYKAEGGYKSVEANGGLSKNNSAAKYEELHL